MSRIPTRRSVATAIGVTAGIASAVGFTAAPVQAAPGNGDWSAVPGSAAPKPAAPSLDALGTCFSWTTLQVVNSSTGQRANLNIPTTGRDNNVRDCILVHHNQTDGVFKVQDAINRCYPQFSAGVGFDGVYGDNTFRAVGQIQTLEGVTSDGKYGLATKTVMKWPGYRPGDNAFLGCHRVDWSQF
jgi:hypothetical protein